MSGAVHVLPLGDEAEHFASRLCWCWPEAQMTFGKAGRVIVHRALDCRKVHEELTGEAMGSRVWGVFPVGTLR